MEPEAIIEALENHGKSFALFVREKAAAVGSTIIYSENGKLIEENPATGEHWMFKPITNAD